MKVLKEIVEKIGSLNVCEQRQSTDEYHELVFFKKEINAWEKVFNDILGPAVKPAGIEPTADQKQLTMKQGGIYKNQTLFKKDFDDFIIIVMFWPWQDDEHITLKMAVLKKM